MDSIKYSKDGLVAFHPEKHEYFMGDKKLIGVTSLIDRYVEVFDTERISAAYAAKHGLIQEEVKAGWKRENDISIDQGHATHDLLETFHHTGYVPAESECVWPKQIQAVRFIKDYFGTGRLVSLEAEMVVHNGVVASQIDNISKNPKEQKFILDYKTNKKIEMYSYRDRRMKRPFSKYMDCNFYHYSIQTGIYRKLCKEYDIAGAYIVHFDVDCYKIIEPCPVFIPDWVLL